MSSASTNRTLIFIRTYFFYFFQTALDVPGTRISRDKRFPCGQNDQRVRDGPTPFPESSPFDDSTSECCKYHSICLCATPSKTNENKKKNYEHRTFLSFPSPFFPGARIDCVAIFQSTLFFNEIVSVNYNMPAYTSRNYLKYIFVRFFFLNLLYC